MKQPAASPGRAEKPQQQQQLPAPPGLARLLLSKSRRGARSRRAPATSPMFVSRGRSRAAAAAAGADGEPSSPKVTCIGQVRMRKGKKGGKKGPAAAAPPPPLAKEEKARGYCRCLKKAFLCGGLFDFDRTRRRKGPAPETERARRSPWVFSSRDVAVAAAPKAPDPTTDRADEEGEEDEKPAGAFGSAERDEKADEPGTNSGGKEEEEEECEEGEAAELASSATTTPPKNALLLMRCRSAPQNRSSPLTSRFAAGAAPSPVQEAADFAAESIAATTPRASPSPRKPDMLSPWPSPSPRKPDMVSPWASPSPRKPGMPLSPRASPSPRKPDMIHAPRASPSPRKPDTVSVESDEEDEKRQETAASTQEQEEKPHEQDHEADDDDEEEEEDEAEEMRCSSARPLVLQRCKSEPATTAAAKMAAGAGAEGAPSGCFWANGGSSGRRRHAPQMSPAAAAPVALTGH